MGVPCSKTDWLPKSDSQSKGIVMTQLGRAVLFSVLLAGAVALNAQIVETGTITGVVRDKSGAVIAKAQVSIRNAATGLGSSTVTDSQGLYVSPPLDPGAYTAQVEA